MRIRNRILPFTLMWIRILAFNLMRIWILPLNFFLDLDPLIILCSKNDSLRPPPFHFDEDQDHVFPFNADPDPAFHYDADPDSAFQHDADPDPAFQNDADPKHCYCPLKIFLIPLSGHQIS
jgi:hypothetical protein